MYRFFEPVVRGLLDASEAEVVVEVGSDRGPGTERLADWCQPRGATLHVIDPKPSYDVEEWSRRWPETVRFHLELSLDALPRIGPSDVVLIDGDHNWYTVFHELGLVAKVAEEHDRRFPLTLLHDVGWPYGRRDLYYDPSTIPEQHRVPHRKGGLVPGQAKLADAGFNDHLFNAEDEGTPHNGVLAGVEDFIDAHAGELELHVIPGLHGLGIIVDRRAPTSVHAAVVEATSVDGLRRVLEAVESDRISLQIALRNLRADYGEKGEELNARMHGLMSDLRRTRRRAERAEREHARLRSRRSVRAALSVADLAGTLLRAVRRTRGD